MHPGVVPDFSGLAGWWQQQDLSWVAFADPCVDGAGGSRTDGRPVADVGSELVAARGIVV